MVDISNIILFNNLLLTVQWELFISAKPFKFFVSSSTHVRKLEARANRKFHADKSFGGVGHFNTLS